MKICYKRLKRYKFFSADVQTFLTNDTELNVKKDSVMRWKIDARWIYALTNKEVKIQDTRLLKFALSKHTPLANALSKFSFWTLNSFSPLSTL